jgi:hypothetical protein
MSDDNLEIQVRQTAKGTEIHSFNYQKNKRLHIGTISGQVFEKGNISILQKPEPSICLMVAELQEAENAGALFLRCISADKKSTYSISLGDFRANAEPYDNGYYGRQLRCKLTKFQYIGAVVQRNAILDNPREGKGELIIRQLNMWGK